MNPRGFHRIAAAVPGIPVSTFDRARAGCGKAVAANQPVAQHRHRADAGKPGSAAN